MDAFRISLIVVGITVLLVIYVFDSNKKLRTYFKRLNVKKIRTYFKKLNLKHYFTKKNHPDDDYAHEPEIDDDSEILEHIEQMEGVVANPYSESTLSAESQLLEDVTTTPPYSGEEMVVVFFILSKNEHYFSGTDIHEVCTANGFEFSDKKTYEKFSDRNLKDNRAVATIVNSFEPGVFDSDFENFDTKAITVILYLPGPDSEMAAFEDIVMRARIIAHDLSGELCDETRSVLTPQTVSHIKEKIEAFQFKNKMLKTSQQR